MLKTVDCLLNMSHRWCRSVFCAVGYVVGGCAASRGEVGVVGVNCSAAARTKVVTAAFQQWLWRLFRRQRQRQHSSSGGGSTAAVPAATAAEQQWRRRRKRQQHSSGSGSQYHMVAYAPHTVHANFESFFSVWQSAVCFALHAAGIGLRQKHSVLSCFQQKINTKWQRMTRTNNGKQQELTLENKGG